MALKRRNLVGRMGWGRNVLDQRLGQDAGARGHVWISVFALGMEKCVVRETKG